MFSWLPRSITFLLPIIAIWATALSAQAADVIGYELIIYGSGSGETGTINGTTIPADDSTPLFKLTNDPLSVADITHFRLAIGNLNYNFDTAVVSTSGSVVTDVGVTPSLNSPDTVQGNTRNDIVDYDLTGLTAGSQFAFSTDVDPDGLSFPLLGFESVFWNNGGSNATITVTFATGQKLVLETPDQGSDAPTSYTFSQSTDKADAYWVGIDLDPGGVGGCDFDLRGVEPDATDIDLLLKLNVDPGPAPMVTSSLLHTCNPGSNLFENPSPVGPAPWPIGEVVVSEPGGVGHVVEASVPESFLQNTPQVRLVLLAESASGAIDVLSTTDGTPGGGPILFSLAVAAPMLSPLGLGMLLSLLLAIGWLFSKRWGNRIGLLLILGFIASVPVVAYALDISLDGLVGDWEATSPVASDSNSDSIPAGLEAEILSLYATQGGGQLSLRVDALTPDPGPVPYLVEADGLFFTDGLVTGVWVFVAPEWLETNEVSLAIEITGINAGFHEHGSQEALVSATTLLVEDQGDALVSVNWTTDPNLTHSPEDYTVCLQAFYNDLPFGVANCATFGPY